MDRYLLFDINNGKVEIEYDGITSGALFSHLKINEIEYVKHSEYKISISFGVFNFKKYSLGDFLNNNPEIQYRDTEEFKDFNTPKAIERSEVSIDEVYQKLNKEGFTRKLKQHQERNLLELINTRSFAEFSVPGTGKTTVALAYYYFMKKNKDKLLVIAPRITFIGWKKEIDSKKGCLPETEVKWIDVIGPINKIEEKISKDEPDILFMTYGKLRQVDTNLKSTTEFIYNYIYRNKSVESEVFIFLDESHKAKNISSMIGQSLADIQSLQNNPDYKLIMTGTPMPNSIDDLRSQFLFSFPDEINLKDEQIFDKFSNLFVRTTKKELKIPEKTIIQIPVEMSENQKFFYSAITDIAIDIFKGSRDMSLRNQLDALNKCYHYLIWASTNPCLLIDKKDISISNDSIRSVIEEGLSNKMQAVCDQARSLVTEGKKVVIWAVAKNTIEELANLLYDQGSIYIHGDVSAKLNDESINDTREKLIDRFHNDKNTNILIASPGSCAEGISLHEVCHDAIYLERDYTLTNFLQSMDRIHRLGIDHNQYTNIYIYMNKDTIDFHIHKRLEIKERRMNELLESKNLENLKKFESEICGDEDINIELMQDIENHITNL